MNEPASRQRRLTSPAVRASKGPIQTPAPCAAGDCSTMGCPGRWPIWSDRATDSSQSFAYMRKSFVVAWLLHEHPTVGSIQQSHPTVGSGLWILENRNCGFVQDGSMHGYESEEDRLASIPKTVVQSIQQSGQISGFWKIETAASFKMDRCRGTNLKRIDLRAYQKPSSRIQRSDPR